MVFNPVLLREDGIVKGNCDAELVLRAMIDFESYGNAVIATGDGDFHCLIQHLLSTHKLGAVLIPNQERFSGLLKLKDFRPYLSYMNTLKDGLAYHSSIKK